MSSSDIQGARVDERRYAEDREGRVAHARVVKTRNVSHLPINPGVANRPTQWYDTSTHPVSGVPHTNHLWLTREAAKDRNG